MIFRLNYDYALLEKVGVVATGFYGFNSFVERGRFTVASNWSFYGGGLGVYVLTDESLRLHIMGILANATGPDFEIATLSLAPGIEEESDLSLGLDIGARIFLDHFLIGIRIMNFTPNFLYNHTGYPWPSPEPQNMVNFNLCVGYTF